MRHTLGTMRTFHTKHFTVIADAIEEFDPDFSFDDTGETQRNIESGKWLCFTARVRVLFQGREVGVDYRGGGSNAIHLLPRQARAGAAVLEHLLRVGR